MVGARQALGWLSVFALGIVVENVMKLETKNVFRQILAKQTSQSSSATVAEAVEKSMPWGVLQDGHGGILELPSALKCDPLQHLLVINLEGDAGKQRREHIKREFAKANLTGRFFFWSAVNALTDPRLAQETGRGQCPCKPKLSNSMSHREIYEMMLYEGWPCTTIFEDDVLLAPNFTLRVSETVGSLPPFDVILWGYCPQGVKPRELQRDAGKYPLTLSSGYPGACLHAYTVSLQGAFTFTQAATPVRVPADGVLDGVKHWDSSVRPHVQKMPGQFTGSYWYSTPMMAVQAADADALKGGS